MTDFRDTLGRVGDAAEPDAFLYAELLRYPPDAEWERLNPPLPIDDEDGAPPVRPSYPRSLAGVSLTRNLNARPRPGESKANAAKRAKRARSYVARLGAYGAAVKRFERRGGAQAQGGRFYARWRVELTGRAEVTTRSGAAPVGAGTQVGVWQRVERGRKVADMAIKAVYLDVARAAVRTKPTRSASGTGNVTDGAHGPGDDVSTIYKGDSDQAVIYPEAIDGVPAIVLRVQWD